MMLLQRATLRQLQSVEIELPVMGKALAAGI